jgi:predicted dehydrogenase
LPKLGLSEIPQEECKNDNMCADQMIRVALIGYGYVGQTFHAPLIGTTPGLELAVVSSSKPDKVREHSPGALVAPSPEAAITDPTIDLVVIASPNATHVTLAATALLAGKHVVVDKPFTLTAEEARRLPKLASEKGRLLSVFHNRRWDADFLTLRKLMTEGTLGPINYFESHFDRFRPEVRVRWREQAGPGSGLWYDLGPHLIDQALQLFGPPDTITATIISQRPDAQTDDYAHVVLGYSSARGDNANALQVVLHCSMLASGGWQRFLVHGNAASWSKRGVDMQESQLLRGMRPGDAEWGIDPSEGTLFVGESAPGTTPAGKSPESVPNLRGCYEKFYAEVRDAILGKGANPVTASDAIRVMAVLEAAFESSRTQATVYFQDESGPRVE